MIFIIWYLSAFIPCLVGMLIRWREITLGDAVGLIFLSLFGPFFYVWLALCMAAEYIADHKNDVLLTFKKKGTK